MELPFWVLFVGCVALGMVHWLAGAVAAGILLAAFFFWLFCFARLRRRRCLYEVMTLPKASLRATTAHGP